MIHRLPIKRRGSTMPPSTLDDLRREISELEEQVAATSSSDVNSASASRRSSSKAIDDRASAARRAAEESAVMGHTDLIQEIERSPVDVPLVKLLAQSRPLSINLPNSSGQTAMHAACASMEELIPQQDVLIELLRLGGNLCCVDNEGRTPLDLPHTPTMATNVAVALRDYTKHYVEGAKLHLPVPIESVLESRSRHSLHVPSCVAPDSPAMYCFSRDGNVLQLKSLKPTAKSVDAPHFEIFSPSPGIHDLVVGAFPLRLAERRFPANDLGGAPMSSLVNCEFVWANTGTVVLVRNVQVFGEEPKTEVRQIVEENPLLRFQTSSAARRGSRLAACCLSTTTPSMALAQYDAGTRQHSFVIYQFPYRLAPSSPTVHLDYLVECLQNVEHEDWRKERCAIASFTLPLGEEPVSVSYVGAANYVLACRNSAYMYNVELQRFQPCVVLASSSRKEGNNEDTILGAVGFATSGLMERFDFLDPLRPISVVCVLREQTVDIYRLTFTQFVRSTSRHVQPVRHLMHIPNTRTGGSFTACVQPTPTAGNSGMQCFLLLRAGSSTTELTQVDVDALSIRIVCAIDRHPMFGEETLYHIVPAASCDGKYVYRRNVDIDLLVVHTWENLSQHMNPEVTWSYGVTSASAVPLSEVVNLVRAPAPTGTVTLVFSDIQSAAEMWESCASMQSVATTHQSIMRRLSLRFRGHEVKMEGTAFMFAFQHAVDAMNFALACQLAHLIASWPEHVLEEEATCSVHNHSSSPCEQELTDGSKMHFYEQIASYVDRLGFAGLKRIPLEGSAIDRWLWRGPRIRMGLHTCTPHIKRSDTTLRMDYMGSAVTTAARVSSSSCGGEIVVSSNTYEALGLKSGIRQTNNGRTICPVHVSDLGLHRLMGVSEPQHLYSVLPEILRERSEEFDELRAQASLLESNSSMVSVDAWMSAESASSPALPPPSAGHHIHTHSTHPRLHDQRKLSRFVGPSILCSSPHPDEDLSTTSVGIKSTPRLRPATSPGLRPGSAGAARVSSYARVIEVPDGSMPSTRPSSAMKASCGKCCFVFPHDRAKFCEQCGERRGILLP